MSKIRVCNSGRLPTSALDLHTFHTGTWTPAHRFPLLCDKTFSEKMQHTSLLSSDTDPMTNQICLPTKCNWWTNEFIDYSQEYEWTGVHCTVCSSVGWTVSFPSDSIGLSLLLAAQLVPASSRLWTSPKVYAAFLPWESFPLTLPVCCLCSLASLYLRGMLGFLLTLTGRGLVTLIRFRDFLKLFEVFKLSV